MFGGAANPLGQGNTPSVAVANVHNESAPVSAAAATVAGTSSNSHTNTFVNLSPPRCRRRQPSGTAWQLTMVLEVPLQSVHLVAHERGNIATGVGPRPLIEAPPASR